MAGHSKWAQIKHQKGAADKKRGNLFSKLSREIAVAARSGGDPETNFQLRLAADKAKAANVPKENIERAIKRGSGEDGGAQLEEILGEGYGPSGTAILIEILTDNRNRALAEVKAVLNRFGGKFAGSGGVAYLFERKGEIKVSGSDADEEATLDSGAQDYQKINDGFLVYCAPGDLAGVKDRLFAAGLIVHSAELTFQPKTTVDLPEEDARKVVQLLESLDELDDVAAVSSNLG